MTPKNRQKKPARRKSNLDWSNYSSTVMPAPLPSRQHEDAPAEFYLLGTERWGMWDFQAAENAARNFSASQKILEMAL